MRIAIVSSYKLECGIARFSEILHRSLSVTHDVTVLELPPAALKKSFGATLDGANRFIQDLCEKLKGYDAVSVQCEYGLFADSISLAVDRISKILLANKNSTITFHTVINRSSSVENDFPSWWRWIARPRTTARGYLKGTRLVATAKSELKLLRLIKNHKIKVIVHTETTKAVLIQKFGLTNVECHPLCYTHHVERRAYVHDACRLELIEKLNLAPEDKMVGVFGFFGAYKGFDYAIKCIARLGDDFKLLVFSGLHPNAIRNSDTDQIDELIALAKKNKVLDRVFFMGNVDDEAMYKAIAGVDFSWLPYREVGQEASAICSEVSELSRRVIASRNLAFIDYMKFNLRDDYEFFEIGNIEELKLKTLLYDRFHPARDSLPSAIDHAGLQAKFYLEVLSNMHHLQTSDR